MGKGGNVRKVINVVLACVIVIFVTGCWTSPSFENNFLDIETQDNADIGITEKLEYTAEKYFVLNAINNETLVLTNPIDDLNFANITIADSGETHILPGKNISYFLFRVAETTNINCTYILYLDNSGKVILHDFGIYAADYSKMNFADIDGDGGNEILLQFVYPAANGNYPSSYILKLDQNNIEILLCADGTNVERNQVNWIDLGFEMTLLDNYQIGICNRITKKKAIYDATDLLGSELVGIIYNEDGLMNEDHPA